MYKFTPLPPDSPARAEGRYLDRLLTLWTNQNTILYGRIQNMVTVQAGLTTAWFVLFSKGKYLVALLVAAVGWRITRQLFHFVVCDLAWKRNIGDALRHEAKGLLPEVDGPKAGWEIMTQLAAWLWKFNVVLLIATACWWGADAMQWLPKWLSDLFLSLHESHGP